MAEICFKIDWGLHALLKVMSNYREDFQTVLEIGSGNGEHSRFFRHFGKEVFSVDLHHDADYVGDFVRADIDRQFDLIWCSHVIEHQRNVGQFLDRIYQCLKPGGLLALSCPVHPRERIVSGHLTSWTPFLLCYNLVLAGFDCSQSQFVVDYELGFVVRKVSAQGSDVGSPAAFHFVSELGKYFPLPIADGQQWQQKSLNWDLHYAVPSSAPGDSLKITSRFLPSDLTINGPGRINTASSSLAPR